MSNEDIQDHVDNIVGTMDVLNSLAEAFSAGGKIDATGEAIGVGLQIYSDITEYGFVWDRQPHTTPRTGASEMVEVPANTSVAQRASQHVVDGWIQTFVPAASALPVPIPRPGDRWSWGERIYCDAGGSLDYPAYDKVYYHGVGGFRGQLLYKFGQYGKTLPVYNEFYSRTQNDTGELFLRINTPDSALPGNSGALKVYIGMSRPSNTPVFIYVDAQAGWMSAGITRKFNWDKYRYNPGIETLLALDVPAVANAGARWYFYPVQGSGDIIEAMCGAAGVSSYSSINIEGDSRYPYNGPGARYGQLLYKWGMNGTVLPVWHSEELGENKSGDLFLRINDGNGRMDDNADQIYVLTT